MIVADVDEENILVTFTLAPYDTDAKLPQDVIAIAEPESADNLTAGMDNRRQGMDTIRPSGLSVAN